MSLFAFFRSRYLPGFASRAAIERHQERAWVRYRQRVMPRSPFYRDLAHLSLDTLPRMTKARLMDHFCEINTCGIDRDAAFEVAIRAEKSRDFRPLIGDVSVGLSTGTSGQRGLFLATPKERRLWAAIMLGRFWPDLGRRQRVAFFMRADNALYRSLSNTLVRFEFFDMMSPLEDHVLRLAELNPTVLIAPARVLGALAQLQTDGALRLDPERVISVAEVLSPDERIAIRDAFGRQVDEVYQATEGVLAMTCRAGNLHLNERWLKIEPDVVDRASGAFCPIVSDFTRESLPILNYRLDDVLIPDPRPCPCGCASMRIAQIEGREDDVLWWPGRDGLRRVPADAIRTTIACLPHKVADYRVIQRGDVMEIWLQGADAGATSCLTAELTALAHKLHCSPPRFDIRLGLPAQADGKRRRIMVV